MKHRIIWHRKRPDGSAAELAQLRAKDDLNRANARWPEVLRLSSSLHELGEQNHFAASIRSIFQGGQPDAQH